MRLQFLAKTVQHLSCGGVNMSKGQEHEFPDEVAIRLLRDFSQDFTICGQEAPAPAQASPKTRKPSLPKKNKAVKKCSTCKQSG